MKFLIVLAFCVGIVQAGMFCSVCIQLVEKVLEAGREDLEPVLEKGVNEVCSVLGSFASLCENYLDGYIDQLVDQIDSSKDANEVCSAVDLC
ncbi:unnamed protein product [Caenorhabditis angaria]|uniref:Saposin B-type domain-containing protein n=1 Tax=Caenorhabditis angaria TaxID=860376 RepID=A0A9P1I886_9PELO|nr:unnamed protein product [Caenorhabditis angaria]